nr:MAG TPA: hypothetical protein [Caudoviricetes sp.]
MATAKFKEGRKEATTEELAQYDYGQTLQIEGLQLPAAVQIHFSTEEVKGEARVEMGATKNNITTVEIPDIYFGEDASSSNKSEYSVFAWVYLDDGESGRTAYRIHMPVKRRPKPTTYTPEEDERLKNTLEQITKIANNLDAKEKTNETNIKANTTAISELQTNFARSEKVSLNEAVERYYAMRRGPDIYTVEELDASTAQACDVNRLDALTGLTCEPSTNTYRGVDQIGTLDAFRPTIVNWVLDDDGNQIITAVEGMPGFSRTGKVNLAVMNMGLYYKEERNAAGNGILRHWSMLPRVAEGYKPLKECVRPDGTVQGWMLHAKCCAAEIDGVPYVTEGYNPVRSKISHANYAYARKQGAAYGYEVDADAVWVESLTMIKYGTRNLQKSMKGASAYNLQYKVTAASTGNKVILAKADAANLVIGSCVSVGDATGKTDYDRGNAYMHNIADSAMITAITSVDDNNSAVYLDCGSITTKVGMYVSTMHWRTGSTNKVLGYDGSPVSNTDGKNICKINEIEILNGGYSVCGNAINIMSTSAAGATTVTMYYTDDARKLTTDTSKIKQQYKVAGTFPATNNAWLYIKDMIVDPVSGYMVPKSFGGGDKTYWADGYYTGENPAVGAETARELLLRGYLFGGGFAGPAFVHAGNGVSYQWWSILGALSPNAVRGEWR